MSTLQTRLSQALKKADITQSELARQSGVNRATVSLWINGPTQKIVGDNLTRVARILGIDPHWLATGESRYDSGAAEERASYLTSAEQTLLRKFRGLQEEDKNRALVLIDALSRAARPK